jgi:DNA-binding transcriptional LysR family regulator
VDVEMRELQCVVAVAEERSFTAAGRRLHLSQQSVSAIVRRLEVKLGTPLFERTTRRVEPTPVCTALVAELTTALALVDRALARAHDAGDRERPLRLAFTPSTGLGALQDLLEAVTSVGLAEPEVRELWSDELPDALRSGRFDAALGVEPAPVPGWTILAWRRQRVDVLVAASHPLAGHRHVGVAELAGTTIVLPEHRTNPGLHDKLLAAFAAAGVAPTIVPMARQSRIAPVSVERGEAATVWLTGMEERHVPDGFVRVELRDPETIVTTDLVIPSSPDASPPLALDALRDLVGRPPEP